MWDVQYVYVGFFLCVFQCSWFVVWGNQYFYELVVQDYFGGGGVQWCVEGDDVVEGVGWVGGVGQFVGIVVVGVDGYVIWVGVFDDDVGWCIELVYVFLCCVGIGQVVVVQFFVLQLLEGGQCVWYWVQVVVECVVLVWVFVVVQVYYFYEGGVYLCWVFGMYWYGGVGGGDC